MTLSSIYFFGSLLLATLLIPGMKGTFDDPRFKRKNYAGREMPTSAGLIFFLAHLAIWAVVVLVEWAFKTQTSGSQEMFLLLVTGMCLIGVLDDCFGSAESKGYGGHLKELAAGRVTTGMIKALGGFLIAMAVTRPISAHIWEWFLNSALIALSANLFNLLDLRPGRAMKVFFPLYGATICVNWKLGSFYIPPSLSVLAVSLVLFRGDLRERFMIGDSGSNVLGAVVGFGLVTGAGNWWKLGLTILFALLNLASERYSFTSIIESNRILKLLDELGRKGENGKEANYN